MDNPSGQATNNIGQKSVFCVVSDENLTLTDHLNKKLLEAFKNTLDTPGNIIPLSEPTDSVGDDEAWQK